MIEFQVTLKGFTLRADKTYRHRVILETSNNDFDDMTQKRDEILASMFPHKVKIKIERHSRENIKVIMKEIAEELSRMNTISWWVGADVERIYVDFTGINGSELLYSFMDEQDAVLFKMMKG